MSYHKKMSSEGFSGIYKEIADLVGIENAFTIYRNLKGQQVSFPKRLYSTEYVLKQLSKDSSNKNIKRLAVEFDYTEKYLRQLMKESDKQENT